VEQWPWFIDTGDIEGLTLTERAGIVRRSRQNSWIGTVLADEYKDRDLYL
jgi:hypothetical protein